MGGYLNISTHMYGHVRELGHLYSAAENRVQHQPQTEWARAPVGSLLVNPSV